MTLATSYAYSTVYLQCGFSQLPHPRPPPRCLRPRVLLDVIRMETDPSRRRGAINGDQNEHTLNQAPDFHVEQRQLAHSTSPLLQQQARISGNHLRTLAETTGDSWFAAWILAYFTFSPHADLSAIFTLVHLDIVLVDLLRTSAATMRATRSLAHLAGLSRHPNGLACRAALNHGGRAYLRPSTLSQAPWQSRRGLSSHNLGGLKKVLRVSDEVTDAVATNKPVVALESTIYTHGALGEDLRLEAIVRENGGVPAVIGILDGVPTVGLTPEELERMVNSGTAAKASRRDLAYLSGMVSDSPSRSPLSPSFHFFTADLCF